jgi:beta-phosphoglucomutase-like phosphatase (HAD superfamily)
VAAKLLNVPSAEYAVVEDVEAGIEAVLAGGMVAIGVGDAASC